MIRILTRVIFFILLFLLSFIIVFIVKRVELKKQKAMGKLLNEEILNISENNENIKKMLKNINPKVKRISYIIYVSFIALIVISFLPIEGEFIRFKTPEASMKYSILDNDILQENTIIEGEGCYFVFSKKNNSYCAISKYGEKVGMVDYKSKSKFIGINSDDSDLVSCHAVYDKNSNTSCYFLVINNALEGRKEDDTILINGKKADCIYYKRKSTSVYSLIVDGKFEDDIVVTINDVEIPILRMLEYTFK